MRNLQRRNLLVLPPLLISLCAAALFSASQAPQSSFESTAGEGFIATITASAPGAEWGRPQAEASIATVDLDGRYNQDVVIDHGSDSWDYRIFLGPLAPGKHVLTVHRNARWSAPKAALAVQKIAVRPVNRPDSLYDALAHAPILYARADTLGHFSDVPLIAWYEVFPNQNGEEIQYSFVFSNEDAGTATAALMARWGRATDIEYAYRVWLDHEGRILRDAFQNFNHQQMPFAGKKDGEHPYILIATLHNTFSDYGASELQYHLVPVRADLSRHSREELMDRFPSSYKIMAEELKHENKLRPFGRWSLNSISDPRNYLYLEVDAQSDGAGLAAWVKIKGDPCLYSSDGGFSDLAIWRSGWFRTTVELPPGATDSSIQAIALQCLAPASASPSKAESAGAAQSCIVHYISKAFLLRSDYSPGRNILSSNRQVKIKPGQMYWLAPK